MGELGYPAFGDLDAPEDSIRTRFGDLMAPLNAALGDLDPDEGRALIEGDVDDVGSLLNLDIEALRSLQSEEIETAISDLDCYDVHVRDIFEPLRDDFERGLMETYGAELGALRSIGQ